MNRNQPQFYNNNDSSSHNNFNMNNSNFQNRNQPMSKPIASRRNQHPYANNSIPRNNRRNNNMRV